MKISNGQSVLSLGFMMVMEEPYVLIFLGIIYISLLLKTITSHKIQYKHSEMGLEKLRDCL